MSNTLLDSLLKNFKREKIDSVSKTVNLQIISWYSYDEENNNDEYDSEYKIFMFGNTEKGESVSVKIDDFTPYFFVRIPDDLQDKWKDYDTIEFKNYVLNKLYKQKKGLVKVSLIEKHDINGFTNGKMFKFLKLIFKNEKTYKKAKYIICPSQLRSKPCIPNISLKELDFTLYEANIEPFIRFCHIQNIKTAGWVSIEKYYNEDNSRCQIDISTKWNNVKPLDNNKICPFTIGSFDIEAISQRGKESQKNIFPDYALKDDYITQIGITLYKFGTDKKLEVMHTLTSPDTGTVDPLENIILYTYESEKELVLGFFDFLKMVDVDYITGYNINTFDWTYLYKRCVLLNIDNQISSLSRINEQSAKYIEEQLNTNAAGENKFKYIKIPGVINSDLYTIVKREQKLISYKLDFVAKTHIGEQKDPLSPLDIFNMALGKSKDIATVCYYCSKDCILVINLIIKLCIIPNNFGMANVTSVPIEYIEYKGQQVKVHAQLANDARHENYLLPTIPYKDNSGNEEEKFTGATVQDAEQDAHFVPISGLDFASLYPSIMIANNMSYETRVRDPKYLNLEGINYNVIRWKEDVGLETEREEEVIFVQNEQGLLPKILDRLWKERKAIKKEMKVIKGQIKELQTKLKETNNEESIIKIKQEISDLEFLYQVKDGYQLAMKVSMNSIYGFTGASLGRLPDKRIAAATTAEGRRMIQACKEYVEANYNCKVVYGDTDSIYVKFFTEFEGQEHMNEVFRLSEIAAEGCSNLFKKPVEMEFEKVMDPFILFSKKRYACLIWTNPNTYDYIDYKGIQVVRRDNCPMVKDRSMEIFESILLEKDIPKSISQARENIKNLLNGDVPIKDLVISKSLKGYGSYEFDKQAICVECNKRYYELDSKNKKVYRLEDRDLKTLRDNLEDNKKPKLRLYCRECDEETDFKSNPANIPHVALARTMEKRDKYNCPVVGERVPYVFKKTNNKKDCQFQKVEDPDYLIKNCLQIDYEYYFEHQLKSALDTIFAPILKDKLEETLYSGLLPEKEKPKRRTKKSKEQE